MNLRISGFDERLERDEIKDILSREFRDFRPFEVLSMLRGKERVFLDKSGETAGRRRATGVCQLREKRMCSESQVGQEFYG